MSLRTRHVFNGLAVGGVVHQLVEALYHVVVFVLIALRCVVGNVACDVLRRGKKDRVMYINQFHSALKIKHEQLAEYN